MKKNIKKKKGFTLIELIIVVAVLGILALIAVPKFGQIQQKSKVKADIATAKTIADVAAMKLADGTLGTYTTQSDLGNDITQELQGGVPTPKAVSEGKYQLKVDANNNVEVHIVYGNNHGTDVTVYPTQTATPYN